MLIDAISTSCARFVGVDSARRILALPSTDIAGRLCVDAFISFHEKTGEMETSKRNRRSASRFLVLRDGLDKPSIPSL